MQDVDEIEDNLRVIRRLMERGQRYEAITGRGALIVGVLSLALAAILTWSFPVPSTAHGTRPGEHAAGVAFLTAWPLLAALAAAALFHSALRIPTEDDARRATQLSAAARSVVRAVIPAYALALAVGVGTLWLGSSSPFGPRLAPLVAWTWAALHGIAILATAHHAPRRLVILGWTFLAAGCAGFVLLSPHVLRNGEPSPLAANAVMALTFGVLHVAYGLFSVLRPLPADD